VASHKICSKGYKDKLWEKVKVMEAERGIGLSKEQEECSIIKEINKVGREAERK
jgi:hypothetical protein